MSEPAKKYKRVNRLVFHGATALVLRAESGELQRPGKHQSATVLQPGDDQRLDVRRQYLAELLLAGHLLLVHRQSLGSVLRYFHDASDFLDSAGNPMVFQLKQRNGRNGGHADPTSSGVKGPKTSTQQVRRSVASGFRGLYGPGTSGRTDWPCGNIALAARLDSALTIVGYAACPPRVVRSEAPVAIGS